MTRHLTSAQRRSLVYQPKGTKQKNTKIRKKKNTKTKKTKKIKKRRTVDNKRKTRERTEK